MIPQLSFLQFAATPNRQPSSASRRAQPRSPFKNPLHWLGLGIAASPHLAWLALPDDGPRPTVTPPRAIMVNWIDAPASKAPSPVIQPQQEPLKPKPKPVKTQPKTRPVVVKSPPVIATPTESASSMTVPVSEPPTSPAVSSPPAQPVPASSSQADKAGAAPAPVTRPHLNAGYLNNPAPTYPALSRQLGEQGKVLVRVLVNAEGNVEQVVLRKTSGYDGLDEAALETVKQWRFVPAKRAAQPIAAWVVVPISFSLEG